MSKLTYFIKQLFCISSSSYSEKALPPKKFSHLLQQTKPSLPQIMHNLHLYENNIVHFDYDYYNKCSFLLMDHLKKLTLGEIYTVLQLGRTHNVRNQLIWKHLQAELHRRLHGKMARVFQKEKKQTEKLIKGMIGKFEKQSKDHFQMLTNQFIQQQQKQQPNTKNDESSQKLNQGQQQQQKSNLPSLKLQQIGKYSFNFVDILIWYGTQNSKLVRLLLQTQLHPNILVQNPYTTIKFAELLTYSCQMHMKTYETNKRMYTARSIKKIYKFQGLYFPELMKNMKATLQNFTTQQIKYLTQILHGFPIKKREHKGKIVTLLADQYKRRGIQLKAADHQEERKALQELLGKDVKLIKKLRENIGYLQQNSSPKEQNKKEQQIQNKEDEAKQKQGQKLQANKSD